MDVVSKEMHKRLSLELLYADDIDTCQGGICGKDGEVKNKQLESANLRG